MLKQWVKSHICTCYFNYQITFCWDSTGSHSSSQSVAGVSILLTVSFTRRLCHFTLIPCMKCLKSCISVQFWFVLFLLWAKVEYIFSLYIWVLCGSFSFCTLCPLSYWTVGIFLVKCSSFLHIMKIIHLLDVNFSWVYICTDCFHRVDTLPQWCSNIRSLDKNFISDILGSNLWTVWLLKYISILSFYTLLIKHCLT